MSQTARITRFSFRGVPAYLGEHQGIPIFSGNPQRVAEWLCDGYRTRFNQCRSNRCKYVYENKQRVLDVTGKPVLVPIGSSVTTLRHTDARQQFPHLSAIPSNVLQAPERIEATEWFAATARRKTLIAQGKDGGAMPGFRSRKRGDRRFSCWFNGGRNAVFHRTGKRSGMLVITGQNPKDVSRKGRWQLRVHVRVSQDIRSYTSVQVDLSGNQVTFINPAPVTDRSRATGSVGIDRGVAHTAVTSDGEFFSVTETPELDNRIAFYQKRMAKSRKVTGAEGRNAKTSRRHDELRRRHSVLQTKRAAVKNDSLHKFTTRIASSYDVIVLEALLTKAMSTKGKGKRKRGLNRGIREARWASLLAQLNYKTGSDPENPKVFAVNPAYTSQRCFACGHIASENRESQAVFRCTDCGFTDNADVNAARNILAKHLQGWASPARSKGKTVAVSATTAPAMKRKPPALARS
jgi:putative transposase